MSDWGFIRRAALKSCGDAHESGPSAGWLRRAEFSQSGSSWKQPGETGEQTWTFAVFTVWMVLLPDSFWILNSKVLTDAVTIANVLKSISRWCGCWAGYRRVSRNNFCAVVLLFSTFSTTRSKVLLACWTSGCPTVILKKYSRTDCDTFTMFFLLFFLISVSRKAFQLKQTFQLFNTCFLH